MTDTPCPSCRTPKAAGRYLCLNCWRGLPPAARRALNQRDARALARLRELHDQLAAGVRVHNVEITP